MAKSSPKESVQHGVRAWHSCELSTTGSPFATRMTAGSFTRNRCPKDQPHDSSSSCWLTVLRCCK
eukprot:3288856-Prymnesium_polylepis.3